MRSASHTYPSPTTSARAAHPAACATHPLTSATSTFLSLVSAHIAVYSLATDSQEQHTTEPRESQEAPGHQKSKPRHSPEPRGLPAEQGSLPTFHPNPTSTRHGRDVERRTERPPAGAMPALPHVYPRIATTAAADTRIIDSRQITTAARHAVRHISTHAGRIIARAPQLLKRASCGFYIQSCYQGLNSGPSPGAVVGIVLGSIVGFLLILWLLWVLSNGTSFIRTTDEEIVTTRRRSRSPRSRRSHRSTYNAEVRQSSPRRERVVRQERIVRNVPREREASRVRETIIVEDSRSERRVDGDNVVEVIEEHSSLGGGQPPPRRKSGRKSSGYR